MYGLRQIDVNCYAKGKALGFAYGSFKIPVHTL
jgi:hypothetical protein